MLERTKVKRPLYPSGPASKGNEGWVDVSLVIGVDGKPHEFLVEDSMGSRPFEKSAVAALKQWRYKPAEFDGEPVQQCHNRVRMVYQLDEKNGVSGKFRKPYRKASQQIEKGDLAALKSTIEDLDPTTLYEGAYDSYLSAIAAEMVGDTSAQLANLRRVISYTNFDTRDSVEIRGKALRRVFDILAN
jgi:TonB family protein